MYVEGLNAPLLAALQRPDLRIVAGHLRPRFDLGVEPPFHVAGGGEIVLGPGAVGPGRFCAFHLRHALELAFLTGAGGIEPCLAGLAAARVAALWWRLDSPGDRDPEPWVAALQAASPPPIDTLAGIWAQLRPLQDPAPLDLDAGVASVLGRAWATLGPVELLLATGGDARLGLDPVSRLNHYGCSHRPRPWAITYASSTASSLSERGFAGAEAARRRVTIGALRDAPRDAAAAAAETRRIRHAIARHYDLPPGTGVVLTASGTDCELIALALASAGATPDEGGDSAQRPLVNVLTAPDETGSGVPLAAVGRHFANDTSRGAVVARGERVAGMQAEVTRADLAVRRSDGTLLPADEVDAACERIVGDAVAAGSRALLHFLDVSKTGLLAPSIDCVARVARRHRGRVDVVVDACQARLTAARIRSYVEIGWVVMVTGSKFFTGPPFCGALLVPPPVLRRFERSALPSGLADYSARTDWPEDVAAASALPDEVNLGMTLRWSAAVAEMQAFARVPASRKREILERFTTAVAASIDANPDFRRVEAPPIIRPVLGDTPRGWDEVQTIMAFLVLGPKGRPLDLEQARRLYQWLNADVTASLPAGLGAADRFLASLRCHIGQPAPVADGEGGIAGALRISAGARLVSGEPSHEGIDGAARLAREIADARACLDKLSLLLRHHAALDAHDPQPSFGAPPEP